MKIKLFVIAVVWLMLGALSSAQAQSSICSCADAKHMLFRIKEANAAINEYKRQIQNYQAQGNSRGNPVMFTQDEYRNNLQKAVQAVLTNVKSAEPPPSPITAGAKTDPHSCSEPEISGGTPCLQEALRRHESHHSNSCSLKRPPRANPVSDYRDAMTMIEVIEEEIVGYTIERAHHSANLPLDFTLDTLTFDSGLVKPTLPYLKGLPDAEKNVRVRVYYRVSKLPEN